MNWDKYDNWKLASPYDNDNTPEVFETEKYNLFSVSEDDIRKFDDLISKIDESHGDFNLFDYSDFQEFLHENIENLASELNLSGDENEALIVADENYHDEKEYAMEQKYQQMKDDKLTRGK